MIPRLQPIYDSIQVCVEHGITHAVICPGSRSAPLTLALARHPTVKTYVINDERSAAFIAMGMARELDQPIALVCTSGSAGYNFAPAVAEAFYQQVPLLILTADRPMEWIDQWDGQTIRQHELYGKHVKRSFSLPADYEHADSQWFINRTFNQAILETKAHPAGPVHINIPLREPLYPALAEEIHFSPVRVIHPLSGKSTLTENDVAMVGQLIGQAKKILILPGQQRYHVELGQIIENFCHTTQAVMLTDVLSNFHEWTGITTADHFLGNVSALQKEELQPELLITFGKSVISKQVKLFLRQYPPAQHLHIQTGGDLTDTFQSLTHLVTSEVADFFREVAIRLVKPSDDSYRKSWMKFHNPAQTALKSFFKREVFGELTALAKIIPLLPAQCSIHAANSMSVRYLNMIGLNEAASGISIWSNRGTSGIDGCTSSTVGHALVSHHLHFLVTGDLAFFYDRNAFWNEYVPDNLRIILLNNHGGVIFSLIDGPAHLPERDSHFVSSQRLNAKSLAAEFQIKYYFITDESSLLASWQDFSLPTGGAKILEIETNIELSKSLFDRLKQQIKVL
jgi:2-succinyl-5-enolpyruvyl-6-hydroxy-3-cyclohexene-1-carboxylate synthase